MTVRDIDDVQLEAWGGHAQASNKLERALWLSAGANPALLERCPHGDRVRYQGLGGVVWATTLLAFCSGTYALYAVFSPKHETALEKLTDWPTVVVATIGGLLWALAVLNVNRFTIASTARSGRRGVHALLHALPRVLIAVVLAVCVAGPLAARLLKPEIDQQLALEQQQHSSAWSRDKRAAYEAVRGAASARTKLLEGRVSEARVAQEKLRLEVQERRLRLEEGVRSRLASGRSDDGPAIALLKQTLEAKQTEKAVLDAQLASDEEAFAAESAELRAQVGKSADELALAELSDQRQAKSLDGLLHRIEIALRIGLGISLAMLALVAALQLGPVFFKLSLPQGAYEFLEENERRLRAAYQGVVLDAVHVRAGDPQASADWSLIDSRFLRAERAQAEECERFETETRLNEQMHEKLRKLRSEELEQNPRKFLHASSAGE